MVNAGFSLLSKQELQSIEKAVERAESQSSGEIVVRCVAASSTYFSARMVFTSVGFLLGVAAVIVLERAYHFSLPSYDVIALLFFGCVLGRLSTEISFLFSRFLPERLKEEAVEAASRIDFFRLGLVETRARTGILIFISAFEHRVRILGDRGIHAKMGDDAWKAEVHSIVLGIQSGKAAQAIIESIDRMGARLVEHFPKQPGDQNELPNRVRSGHGVIVGAGD